MKIIAFRKTANRYWAVMDDGKEFLVSYVFVTKRWGILAELIRETEGNFCADVAEGTKVPEELM